MLISRSEKPHACTAFFYIPAWNVTSQNTNMGFRFRKKIKVFPGFSINLSKSGISTTTKLGPLTVNSRRGASLNLPGGSSYHLGSRTTNRYTKADLVEIAKSIGLKGYSKLNKAELEQALKDRQAI